MDNKVQEYRFKAVIATLWLCAGVASLGFTFLEFLGEIELGVNPFIFLAYWYYFTIRYWDKLI